MLSGTLGSPYSTIRKLKFCQTTDTPDFKLDCVKMFLRRFSAQCPSFKRKLQAVLEFLFRESDEIHPHSTRTENQGTLGIK